MSKILFLVSPTLNSFFDPRKGTTGNKIDCAMHHYTNSVVSNAEIAAVGTVAGLIGKSALKKQMVNNAALTELMASKGNLVKKAVEIYKAVPTPVKAIAGALIALSLLVRTYNKGKIEQKYLDRAQFVDHTFHLDGEGPKGTVAASKVAQPKAATPVKK